MNLPTFIRSKIDLLSRDDYPPNGICSHLGVSFSFEGNNIGFAEWNQDSLLIMVYQDDSRYRRDGSGNLVETGRSKEYHDQIISDVSIGAESRVIQTWNGEDGNIGVSIVLERKCPLGLLASMMNYHKIPNVFACTPDEKRGFAEFDKWLLS